MRKLSLFIVCFVSIFFSQIYTVDSAVKVMPVIKIFDLSYDKLWEDIISFMRSSNGPGISKKSKKKGLVVSSDIIEKTMNFTKNIGVAGKKKNILELKLSRQGLNKTSLEIKAVMLEYDFVFNSGWNKRNDPKNQEALQKYFLDQLLNFIN